MKLAVLHYPSYENFLVQRLFPTSQKIRLAFGDSADQIFNAIDIRTTHFLFHIDLSNSCTIPTEREVLQDKLYTAGIIPLNAVYCNLSKKVLQTRLRELGLPTVAPIELSDEEHLVIVKTDANYGAESEMRLDGKDAIYLNVKKPTSMKLSSRSYRVVKIQDVPRDVLIDPAVTIERYIHNPYDQFYRIYVSGKAIIAVKAHCPGSIKKLNGDPRDVNCFACRDKLKALGNVDGYPSRLAEVLDVFLRNVPLEYGSLDIVFDDDFFIVDVNTTPWGGEYGVQKEISAFLRAGIEAI